MEIRSIMLSGWMTHSHVFANRLRQDKRCLFGLLPLAAAEAGANDGLAAAPPRMALGALVAVAPALAVADDADDVGTAPSGFPPVFVGVAELRRLPGMGESFDEDLRAAGERAPLESMSPDRRRAK